MAAAVIALATAAFSPAPWQPGGGPDLDQGWNVAQQTEWYASSQGSRLLPLAWFEALEQPGATGALFLDPTYISRFRYLPGPTAATLRLPLGFVADATAESQLSSTNIHWKAGQAGEEQWVGLNCAACHTAEIEYQGRGLRVDGGPTLADFQSFMEALDLALVQTHDDDAKLTRFARRVLGIENPGSADLALLKGALAQLIARRAAIGRMNAAPIRYGFGRLDAFGHIFNQVALDVRASSPKPNPADAPVSYPFLWNTPQHENVQWNGIAPNKAIAGVHPFDIGALGRNTGEVIGVFADVTPQAPPAPGYRSSVNVRNLAALERLLDGLRPPRWPDDVFGAPKPEDVSAGAKLFDQHCAVCHMTLARDDLKTRIPLRMAMFRGPVADFPASKDVAAPGTDPWMACNAYTYTVWTGVVQGTRSGVVAGAPLGPQAPASVLLTTTVAEALLGQGETVAQVASATFFGLDGPPAPTPPPAGFAAFLRPRVAPVSDKDRRLAQCMDSATTAVQDTNHILGYKIRPLTGIWATAPYLHNGSVATLYDLLLPPAARPKTFFYGGREFDPDHVGYKVSDHYDVASGNTFEFRTVDAAGTPIPGNSNLGHDYGNAALSTDDRRALIAYLKTL